MALSPASAQIEHWTKVQVANLECAFPKAYTPLQFTGASGYYYDGGSIYLTVTSIPDTFPMKGSLDRDYSKDFAQVVLQTSRRLNGRVREYRDTVIGNMPGYICKQEITFKTGKKSYYELLQVLSQDSIRAFSSQYYEGDEKAIKDTRKFFQSVKYTGGKKASGSPGRLGLWIGGGVLVLLGVWLWMRRRH